MDIIVIRFKDTGQDFLEWHVSDGVIIDCQPFQFSTWVGRKAKVEGSFVSVTVGDSWSELSHEIESVTPASTDYAAGYVAAVSGGDIGAQAVDSAQYRFGFLVGVHNQKAAKV
jgi:hypothetical protein